MSGFGFPTLAIIVVVGLIGPLLALNTRLRIPVVIGELIAGIVIGRTGFGWIDAFDPTFKMFADVGFALVMFVAGTHVPIRDKAMVAALPRAALRAIVVGAVGAVLGLLLANAFNTGHAPLYAVLIASSSAALVLPIIDSLSLQGPKVLSMTAQVAIADTASIVLLPLVIDLKHAPRAAVGAVAVAACAGIVFVILRALDQAGLLDRFHDYSKQRRVAMELRISLAIVFGLAALAVETHVSIMLAGFALGLVVAGIGEPRRLAKQLFGFTEGFFSPLFFLWLGASLHVRELGENPRLMLLGLGLGAAAVLAHLVIRLLGQPISLGALASAQLGVPIAAAAIGEQQQSLMHGEAAALILGALVTIVAATLGGSIYAKTAADAQPGVAKPEGDSDDPGVAGVAESNGGNGGNGAEG
ncbi:cation:proton antiporter [Mycobacteroides saopaulense]|uniref:Sodium:proton antiporter n=1 Tax=Mycobacteroides saopaulense TaxID=1578165 RepID=A0ABX3C0D8_9MYCO|nr:cation:proton antiporter [Mycobacteroides saopaulense]OHT83222.1 sodium:proton antiporter [Mycobacteroides saopaulense]OHU09924.1 sodium:proton antiporter [Mycobacteroides saopaulense]